MEPRNLTVSVIIPTYNSGATIIQALESIFNQTYSDWEIIVVDDGSTDSTREILQPFIDEGKILYILQKNQGCGVARNQGIKISKGSYIAFLDADDYWHAEKLTRQLDVFRAHPKCVVCYTDPYLVDMYSNLIWETMRTELGTPRSGNLLWCLPFRNIITLSSAIVPRWAFEKVEGFTEEYELMMVADYDLWLKLAPLGEFQAIATPLSFYRYRLPGSHAKILANYRIVLAVLWNRTKAASFPLKPLYFTGWFSYLLRYWIRRIL